MYNTGHFDHVIDHFQLKTETLYIYLNVTKRNCAYIQYTYI